MAHYYADSSVLVKRHIPETGTTWIRALTEPSNKHQITSIDISRAEVVSALNRRRREETLDEANYTRIVRNFMAICIHHYTLIPWSDVLVTSACGLLERHPLRAYDAIQLNVC